MRRNEPPSSGPPMTMPPAGPLPRPKRHHGTSGWECPRCHTIWGPHVDRCDCEPKAAGDRTEITEN